MKRCDKKKIQKRKSESCAADEIVCFFCDSSIEAGEEIVLCKNKNYYHRECYDFLFTLKHNHVASSKRIGQTLANQS
jgi:hypothetical protein